MGLLLEAAWISDPEARGGSQMRQQYAAEAAAGRLQPHSAMNIDKKAGSRQAPCLLVDMEQSQRDIS